MKFRKVVLGVAGGAVKFSLNTFPLSTKAGSVGAFATVLCKTEEKNGEPAGLEL